MSIQVRSPRPRPKRSRSRKPQQKDWSSRLKDGLNKLMAAIALANLGLVAFDASYIPLRDFYLRQFPELTQWYGANFKGIEPHRFTAGYLETVNQLKAALEANGLPDASEMDELDLQIDGDAAGFDAAIAGLLTQREGEAGSVDGNVERFPASDDPSAAELLRQLQIQSVGMIDENPFEIADKSGTLERIKNEMRDRVNEQLGTDIESSKQAFAVFWSQDYLAQQGWTSELEFFNAEIRPLMATNYYRSIGEDGRFIEQFWKIDRWFIALFAFDFLIRTFALSRRYRGTSWFDTMLWRWYDIFLFTPFWLPPFKWVPLLRWMRAIPVIVRINQSNLIDLEPLNNRIRRFIVTHFAIEMTETVVIRLIEQAQNLLRTGEVSRALLQPKQYIDLNDINEVETITQRLVSIFIYQVLPEARPEVEAILDHSVKQALNTSPVYSGVQYIPGLSDLPDRLTHQLSHRLFENIYGILSASLKDEKAAELNQRLIEKLGQSLRDRIKQGGTVEEFESLLVVWLEEIKINYVQSLAEEDVEVLREQTYRIYEMSQ